MSRLDGAIFPRAAQQALSSSRTEGLPVFGKLSEILGCADWSVGKVDDGYIATAASCKLCALSKKMGGANPCNAWCLDPAFAMITAVTKIDAGSLVVESTLMTGDCCKVLINTRTEQNDTAETALLSRPAATTPALKAFSGISLTPCDSRRPGL